MSDIFPFISLPSSIVSELAIFIAIALVIFIVLKLSKLILKFIFGIIANSALGLILIFLLNSVLNLGITLTTPILVATAIFGLPAAGTIIVLKLFGAI